MINLGNKAFESEISSFLKEQGYVWPLLMNNMWVKNNLLFKCSYESRDEFSCSFGAVKNRIDANFFNANDFSNNPLIKPYAYWLPKIGENPELFSEACGGWVEGGLITPNYQAIASIIKSTLSKIEANICL